MKKGILVALEGIDGSGKSTQAVLLKLHLERQHISTRIIKLGLTPLSIIIFSILSILSCFSNDQPSQLKYSAK